VVPSSRENKRVFLRGHSLGPFIPTGDQMVAFFLVILPGSEKTHFHLRLFGPPSHSALGLIACSSRMWLCIRSTLCLFFYPLVHLNTYHQSNRRIAFLHRRRLMRGSPDAGALQVSFNRAGNSLVTLGMEGMRRQLWIEFHERWLPRWHLGSRILTPKRGGGKSVVRVHQRGRPETRI